MASMTYKGYTAELEVDMEDGILHGEVMGLRDVITFEAETVPRAIEEFHASVDFYLDVCARRGQEPEKPYSGNFLARIGPDLHRRLATFAQQRKDSINSVITEAVENYIGAETTGGHGARPPESAGGHAVARPRKAKGA
jgi:predicted HicB family RNase H-like nuclease